MVRNCAILVDGEPVALTQSGLWWAGWLTQSDGQWPAFTALHALAMAERFAADHTTQTVEVRAFDHNAGEVPGDEGGITLAFWRRDEGHCERSL